MRRALLCLAALWPAAAGAQALSPGPLASAHADIDGDAHFPAFDPAQFVEECREAHHADADNAFDFDFVRYRRR